MLKDENISLEFITKGENLLCLSLTHSLTLIFFFTLLLLLLLNATKTMRKNVVCFGASFLNYHCHHRHWEHPENFLWKRKRLRLILVPRLHDVPCTFIFIYFFSFFIYFLLHVGRVFSSNKLNLYKIREKFFFSYSFLLASGENFSNFSRHFFLFFLLSPVVSCCILTIYINFPVFSTVFFIVIHHLHFVFIWIGGRGISHLF